MMNYTSHDDAWEPNLWLALVLGLFVPPLAMLYLQRRNLAILYFVALLSLVASETYFRIVENTLLFYVFSFEFLIGIICAIHVYFICRHFESAEIRPWYSRWYGLLTVIGIFYLVLAGIRTSITEPIAIESEDMTPTIPPYSIVHINKWGYGNYKFFGITILHTAPTEEIHRGELLAFEVPEADNKTVKRLTVIRRVIGLPGDKITYIGNRLSVNAETATITITRDDSKTTLATESIFGNEYAIEFWPFSSSVDQNEFTVPHGEYYVLGDNRNRTTDSRNWGSLPKTFILGKVYYIQQLPRL